MVTTVILKTTRRGNQLLAFDYKTGVEIDLDLSVLVPKIRDLYGLVQGADGDEYYVADKMNSIVHQIRVELPAKRVHLLRSIQLPAWSQPCFIDFHKEQGLLIGCFGSAESEGGVFHIPRRDSSGYFLPKPDVLGSVSHCCWIEQGYAAVSRTNHQLFITNNLEEVPKAVSTPTRYWIPPLSGSLDSLMLSYVQGILWSPHRRQLLLADACHGIIVAVDTFKNNYSIIAGIPKVSLVSDRANLERKSDTDCWLGNIRALIEISNGNLLILDGESGQFFTIEGKKLSKLWPISTGKSFHHGVGLALAN